MSSPETPKQTLIPAGLPMSYIGGYAVLGIASLIYISAMMSAPGGAMLDSQQQNLAEARTSEPAQESVDNAPAGDLQTPIDSIHPDTKTAQATPPIEQVAAGEYPTAPSQGIETKYVSTQQILASQSERSATAPEPAPQKSASALPPAANPPATSNIITGSITVPPPPERAPPPPAVIRAALKPAVAPALPTPPRKNLKPAPTPVTFGPAVVTETKAQPNQPRALAVVLATGSSVESLRLTWNLLQERHAAALLDLNPRYIVEKNPAVPERGYALMAGPVVSATEVARVCGALVREGLTCRTRPFGGKSL